MHRLSKFKIYSNKTSFQHRQPKTTTTAIPTINLVILDIMTPGISGYDACQQIRQWRTLHDLPVVFLSAKKQVKEMQLAYEVGGNAFLSKPIIKEELLARVKTHLQLLESSRSSNNSRNI
ncbi:MAG: hypothetical protein COA42_06260 [Alteromonadaceae bacterium]|nr:MAG: hypothetical protein COA42_06260 [Alteromonadaceae bacterium]